MTPPIMAEHGFRTGKLDSKGNELCVGDIVVSYYNEFYGDVSSVITWSERHGAFITSGKFESGGGWNSLNAEDFGKCTKVGDVKSSPGLLKPARKIK